jgi:predicted restriction endonuclease
MSSNKKRTRQDFRDAVFKRDGHKCRACGSTSKDVRVGNDACHTVTGNSYLDAHHITDRNLMPNGGYVVENGISLCPTCHEMAEVFHSTGTALPGFAPEDLYTMIGSSHEQAIRASERLMK